MEGGLRTMSCLMVVMVMLLGVFVGQSSASLSCYAKCFPWSCGTDGPGDLITCAAQCAAECTIHVQDDVNYYCNVGCSTHLCASLSTPQDLALEQVKACVNNCSDKCSKKH